MMGVGSGTGAEDTACSSDIKLIIPHHTVSLVLCTQFQHIFCDKFVSNYTNFGHSQVYLSTVCVNTAHFLAVGHSVLTFQMLKCPATLFTF